jgi:spermidine/putrescine transport system permease protein
MLGQLRRIITPEINAISTVLVSLSISVVGVFFFIDRKFGK